jgi:peptide subunit release factor 1 (eRF1)
MGKKAKNSGIIKSGSDAMPLFLLDDPLSLGTRIKCCHQKDTLRALEMGAAETLVCWENLDVQRITLKNHASGEEKILHLTSEQEKDKTHFTDAGKSFHNFR